MYDGFSFPKKWHEDIPEEIKTIENINAVMGTQEYLSAMIEKICDYLVEVTIAPNKNEDKATDIFLEKVNDTQQFFRKNLQKDIECVCMAFHSGQEWRSDSEKIEFIQEMIDKNIKIKIILNDKYSVEGVYKHMFQPLKRYVGNDALIEEWTDIQKQFPKNIEIRLATVPLMHRSYIIKFSDGKGCVNVKYYTYGKFATGRDQRGLFTSDDEQYNIYCDEFEYLWENATIIPK